ncbi:hypothetical protein Vretimale_5045 [Volvox reticuliferus]|uniref:Uncharacterized protein n=1 Tax=Volvox reticuliferus TaxID=1737510 RepID=A0A8J4FGU7_9CHLO|nr:hypothetical protein Vretifemale_4091 [Volvox reticuliferus]GIL99980.1 hypothetical protein Vretimale_5045 [Volvox reticuliferus]
MQVFLHHYALKVFVVFVLIVILFSPVWTLDLISKASEHVANFQRTQAGPRLAAEKCVFILATAHSGSTALMDALNQIPNYLIRGENWAANYNLFNAYQRICSIPRSPGQSYINWREHGHASLHTVKSLYEAQANRRKLPFFHEFDTDRVIIATRVYYKVLFGHFGDGIVTGSKETRYVCGTTFASHKCEEQFSAFLKFLKKICISTKVLLLTRTDHSTHANPDIFEPLTGGEKILMERNLGKTHQLYDEYVSYYPEHAFRVHMEDMFDLKVSYS